MVGFSLLSDMPQASAGANRWEVPGGKIDFGEDPETCVKREIKEELGVEIEVEGLHSLISHTYDYPDLELHLLMAIYTARIVGGELQPIDCQNFAWVSADDLGSYELTDADVPLTKALLGLAV